MKSRFRFTWLFLLTSLILVKAEAQQAPVSLPDPVAFAHAPNLSKTWPSIQASPIYAAVKTAWDRKVAQGTDPKMLQFMASKAQMEQDLGFSLNPQDIFGTMITGGSFSLVPGPAGTNNPTGLIALNLGDAAKFDKVMDYVKTKSQDTASTQPAKFREETEGDLKITVFNPDTPKVSYTARRDNLWVLSNRRDIVVSVLQGAGAAVPAEVQQSLQKIQKIRGDVYFFADMRGINSMIQEAAAQSGQTQMNAQAFEGINAMSGAIEIQPQEVLAEYFMEVDPESQSILAKMSRTQPGQPQGLEYMPQTAWVASTQNNLNLPEFFKLMKEQANTSPDAAAQVNQALAQADAALGMSVENELLPSFGSNVIIGINNVMVNPSFPMGSSADILLGIEVKNRDKVLQALQTLEKMIQDRVMAQMGMAGGGAQPTPEGMPQLVVTEDYNGTQVHSLMVSNMMPMIPNLSPSYVIDGNFLLLNLSKDNLKKALDMKNASSGSMANHPALGTLNSRFGLADYNQVSYMNFEAMAPLGAMIKGQIQMKMTGANPDQQIGIDLLAQIANSFRNAVGASRFNGTDVHSVGVFAMKPAAR